MSDDNQVPANAEDGNKTVETVETPEPQFKSVDEAVAALKELQAERAKDSERLKTLRKYEKEQKEKVDAALKEQGKFKELLEAKEAELQQERSTRRNATVNSLLKDALQGEVESVETALKLVDKKSIVFDDDGNPDPNSITKAIRDLEKSDPILFKKKDSGSETPVKTAPSVKRPIEGAQVSGYAKEIANAKTQKELEAVIKKYKQ